MSEKNIVPARLNIAGSEPIEAYELVDIIADTIKDWPDDLRGEELRVVAHKIYNRFFADHNALESLYVMGALLSELGKNFCKVREGMKQ